jgi:hypothetical protein
MIRIQLFFPGGSPHTFVVHGASSLCLSFLQVREQEK